MAESALFLPPPFFELHAGLARQGPGADAHTRRAFALVGDLPPAPVIVDVGCGPGMQTLELARLTRSTVHAVYRKYGDYYGYVFYVMRAA